MPSEPPSSILTGASLESRADATEPERTLLPLSLDAEVDTLGEGPGESAAPSISSFGAFGLRALDGAGLRGGSLSVAFRSALRISMFLIRSAGSSLSIFCSSSASLTPSRVRAPSSSISLREGAVGEVLSTVRSKTWTANRRVRCVTGG